MNNWQREENSEGIPLLFKMDTGQVSQLRGYRGLLSRLTRLIPLANMVEGESGLQ